MPTKAAALALVTSTGTQSTREASADRYIAGKSAHALLAIIGAGTALPYDLTAQDIASADVRRTARKAEARNTAAA